MTMIPQASVAAFILAAWLGPTSWSVADDPNQANRVLWERMTRVSFADPLDAEGATTDQQFCDLLQKISDRYASQWKESLPIRIDFESLQQLRSSANNLNASIGLKLRDVPLPETLRYWCGLAGLVFKIADGAVLITTER